ncbi:hypothetical protein OGAPHI_000218 [Ogataea philodendri]|uniref:Uncharacterized protein n=1 Tax=Ogataea philodendri TaxID=1378263 RepID=A0A9P8PH98_9ASCO|nr:uncharacterized protein OGAPHI_000218 [Ogataea philodendri]KAH3671515.1 hypothetical protein OGAPHI_000218 [Ogataea philodendri]
MLVSETRCKSYALYTVEKVPSPILSINLYLEDSPGNDLTSEYSSCLTSIDMDSSESDSSSSSSSTIEDSVCCSSVLTDSGAFKTASDSFSGFSDDISIESASVLICDFVSDFVSSFGSSLVAWELDKTEGLFRPNELVGRPWYNLLMFASRSASSRKRIKKSSWLSTFFSKASTASSSEETYTRCSLKNSLPPKLMLMPDFGTFLSSTLYFLYVRDSILKMDSSEISFPCPLPFSSLSFTRFIQALQSSVGSWPSSEFWMDLWRNSSASTFRDGLSGGPLA